jgi:tRNA G46 methylase TrmB
MPQLEELSARLAVGGRIHFVTDFYDYYVQAKVLVLLHPRMELLGEPPQEDALISMFGRRFVDWGKDIFYVNARRRS